MLFRSHNTIYNSHQGLHFESADVTGGNFLTVSHNTISGIDGIGIEFNRNGSNLDIQYNYLSNWRSGDPNGMALSIVPTGSVNTIKNNYASAVGCTTCNIGLEANGSNSNFENNEIHGFFNSIAISCAPGSIFQNNSISQFGKYGPFMRDGGYCSGYAIGRNIQYYDRPAIRAIVRDAAKNNYTFASLAQGIVKSAPFQMRAAMGAQK